jgi:hypothetical protein
MVLDVKFMEWAAANGLDTAKLKAAKIPVFGKWYFPEIPAGIPLVNLKSGETRTFPQAMLAGETLWAPESALRQGGLWPSPAKEQTATTDSLGGMRPGEPTPAPVAMPATQADAPPVPEQGGPAPADQPGVSEESPRGSPRP